MLYLLELPKRALHPLPLLDNGTHPHAHTSTHMHTCTRTHICTHARTSLCVTRSAGLAGPVAGGGLRDRHLQRAHDPGGAPELLRAAPTARARACPPCHRIWEGCALMHWPLAEVPAVLTLWGSRDKGWPAVDRGGHGPSGPIVSFGGTTICPDHNRPRHFCRCCRCCCRCTAMGTSDQR